MPILSLTYFINKRPVVCCCGQKNNIFASVNAKTTAMKKRGWLIPMLIVAINVVAVAVRWSSLAEQLPAHFDLQGNASGTMARSVLLLYPLMGVVMSLVAYLIACRRPQLQTGLVVLASGGCLVLLLSTMVTLTAGTMPIFMLAEPVVLLVAVGGFVKAWLRSRKA